MPETRELRVQPLGTQTIRSYDRMLYPRFLSDIADRLEAGKEWIVVRRYGSYSLCQNLNGSAATIKAEVPDTDEIIKLAEDLHGRHEPYESVAWNWPIRYTPGVLGHQITPPPKRARVRQLPRLELGTPGLWRAVVTWRPNGNVDLWIERFSEDDP